MAQHNFEAILTDIEGTTTSIDFVKTLLFPFAAKHAENFIKELVTEKLEPIQQKLIDDLIQTSNESAAQSAEVLEIFPTDNGEALASKLVSNVLLWISQDKKHTALKNLQGFIWEEGYKKGMIRGHVYPDVPDAFKLLRKAEIPVYIFSSGSVKAQQLLFSHTEYGDLTVDLGQF